ncbi:MAG: Holliday junction resolvase RuvX [Chloroflexi bacterium]|nr:Holliday junction resolvase RuvX [Chloroflexota bacterium]
MGRILGLDIGERRIGIAISTPEGRLAVPLRVLESRGDAEDARAIAGIANAERVDSLVVGHPLSLDGSVGPQARRVEAFARLVARESGLPLELWDERLSSAQAERPPVRPRRRGSKGGRRRRGPADDVAAAIVLQSYLDRQQPDSLPQVEP